MVRLPNSNLIGKRVNVYRNLNNGLWSVKYGSEPVVHVDRIHLQHVLSHVNPKAQARIAAGDNRTVHAWATGTVKAEGHVGSEHRVLYDPRIHQTFIHGGTGAPLHAAYYASFETRPGDSTPGCYINDLPF